MTTTAKGTRAAECPSDPKILPEHILSDVVAAVLTYSSPESLAAALSAISKQTLTPQLLVVVDNAGNPPATVDALPIPFSLSRTRENHGPAGGWATAIEECLAIPGWKYLWLMDDDCVPRQDALMRLYSRAESDSAPEVVMPEWILQPEGQVTNYPAWCGFLIRRDVIEHVGLPRREFIWWAEDTEWLHWRIPRAGFPVVRERTAVVDHYPVRRATPPPLWKTFYETRNTVYFRLWVQDPTLYRTWRLLRTLVRLLGRSVLAPSERVGHMRMFALGLGDGLRGRLGLRIPIPK